MTPSEKENKAFERLLAKYGTYRLARKIERLPSYRTYKQHWPFDGTDMILSIEQFEEQGIEFASEDDQAYDYAIKEELSLLKESLTPKQLSIVEHMEQGLLPKEFFKEEGYQNTGGIRYHKFIIRKKHRQEHSQEHEQDNGDGPKPV